MIEEKLINGYKCRFQDSKKAPECNFISIPIVHEAKYNDVNFAIGFTPTEEETFGKRIQLIGSSTFPIKEEHFVVSVFTFTYMEDDDLEFIKKKVTFFFKEKEDVSTTEVQSVSKDTLVLYNYGMSKLITIKIIKDYFDTTLLSARDSINSISITGYVDFNLSKLSISERKSLLANLSSNNVKYEIQ